MQAQPQPFILPDRTVVFFHEKAEKNERASEQFGAPRYDRVVVASLKAPGQRSSEYCFEAARHYPEGFTDKNKNPVASPKLGRELDMARPILDQNGIPAGHCTVRAVYDLWIKQQTPADSGTPLENWPQLDVAQVQTLKHVNVYTVEQLAGMPDGFLPNCGLGVQARAIRAKAQAFVQHATDGSGKVEALAARLDRFEDEMKAKDAEIEELRRENARLLAANPAAAAPAAQPARRGGRRANKPDDVEGDVARELNRAERGADEDEDFV
jgi:hypothetical protein